MLLSFNTDNHEDTKALRTTRRRNAGAFYHETHESHKRNEFTKSPFSRDPPQAAGLNGRSGPHSAFSVLRMFRGKESLHSLRAFVPSWLHFHD
jgi:hypothetical protein